MRRIIEKGTSGPTTASGMRKAARFQYEQGWILRDRHHANEAELFSWRGVGSETGEQTTEKSALRDRRCGRGPGLGGAGVPESEILIEMEEEEEEESDEARQLKRMNDPMEPGAEERRSNALTHMPYRTWTHCVRSRRNAADHGRSR